jgi:hypothetical protein
MKKKTEIPTNIPNTKKKGIRGAERPQTNTREDIRAQEMDQYNPNNGPEHRSRKKKF